MTIDVRGDALVTTAATDLPLDRVPVLHLLPPGLCHLTDWVMRYGDPWDAADDGVRLGLHEPDCDDADWLRAQRCNTISGNFPTWEGDCYRGHAWYRSRFTLPAEAGGRTGRLRLGSPAEARDLSWEVWLDGRALLAEPLRDAVVDLPLTLTPGDHVLAVRQRIAPPARPDDQRAELEGWRRVDPFCHQAISWDEPEPVRLDRVAGPATLTDEGGRWRLELAYRTEGGTTRSARLRQTGGEPVIISEIELGGRYTELPAELHHEGAWAGYPDGWMVAGADPACVITADRDGTVVRCWPGIALAADTDLELPELCFDHDPVDWRLAVYRRLAGIGPRRAPLAVYDPYGWYQISHPSEPKIELDPALLDRIDPMLERLAVGGLRFSHLALDTGWNDPDDLSRFHPGNFPDGPGPVTELCRRHGLELILWVSPSDGARSFRHELGLRNPGLDDCLITTAGSAWRLCPAAEPWRSRFADTLRSLIDDTGATGFKIDGTELFCTSERHGHLPGIWSLWSTTRALAALFTDLRRRPGLVIMLYWGLRSPWWLRWADTVWDGGYLVEAAAPAGRPTWSLRAGVACCQDNGQWIAAPSVPADRQDSLGVWLSDTAWASHQGSAHWDDAMIMDLARGSRLTQPWGDLRPMADDQERLREVACLIRERTPYLEGERTLIGHPGRDGYGYAWTLGDRTWLVVAQPGPGGTTPLPVAAGRPGRIEYLSRDTSAELIMDADGLRLVQTGGSVVAVLLDHAVDDRAPRPPVPAAGRVEPIRAVITGAVPADRETALGVWLGRVPGLDGWLQRQPAEPALELVERRVPPDDRQPTRRAVELAATLHLDRPGQAAVVLHWQRNGAAWHHDHLHEITELTVHLDGAPVAAEVFPAYRHDQAGSWSWVRLDLPVPAGDHDLRVTGHTAAPATVTITPDIWLR